MYYAKLNVAMMKEFNKKPETYPHPGYAWAASSAYLEKTNGLYEFNIVGSGDKLMSYGALNMWEYGLQAGFKISQGFFESCRNWSASAIPDRGYNFVPGKLIHNYHGERKDRNYVNRWALLEKYQFNPSTDLVKNKDGVLQLRSRLTEFMSDIEKYFFDRKEHVVHEGLRIGKMMEKTKVLPPLAIKNINRKNSNTNGVDVVIVDNDLPGVYDGGNNDNDNRNPDRFDSPRHSDQSHSHHSRDHSNHDHSNHHHPND